MTIGALYMAQPRPVEVEPAAVESASPETEKFKTDYISIAILDEGNLSGYLTGRARGTQKIGLTKDQLRPWVVDALHRVVYAGKYLDPEAPLDGDFRAIAADVKDLVNKRTGDQLIVEMELTDVGFLTHR